MLKEILESATTLTLIKDGKRYDISELKPEFSELLKGAYFSPSYNYASELINAYITKDIWLELKFNSTQSFKENKFEKLCIQIKPKYDFLILYRYYDGIYQGKCINLTLSQKTTEFYKILKNFEGNNNEK